MAFVTIILFVLTIMSAWRQSALCFVLALLTVASSPTLRSELNLGMDKASALMHQVSQ
jgi:hypothetical protein